MVQQNVFVSNQQFFGIVHLPKSDVDLQQKTNVNKGGINLSHFILQ